MWAADEMEAMREVGGELFEEKEDFLVAVIGDLDFLMMYAPALDGIDRIEALGTGSFSVDDWFQPYSLSGAITNPLTWPEEIAYLYEKWESF